MLVISRSPRHVVPVVIASQVVSHLVGVCKAVEAA